MDVGQFNDGATALVKVLKKMGRERGHFMSKGKSSHIAIQRRKVLRALKKGFIDRNKEEGTSYSAGEF